MLRSQFDQIPCSYTSLLPQFLQKGLIEKVQVMKVYNPPYPNWYKPDTHSDYHYGIAGHSTEDCYTLKTKVQNLMNEGKLRFAKIPYESRIG